MHEAAAKAIVYNAMQPLKLRVGIEISSNNVRFMLSGFTFACSCVGTGQFLAEESPSGCLWDIKVRNIILPASLPFIQGGGQLILMFGVGLFSAPVTNTLANVAVTAPVLPDIIPTAQLEGVNPAVMVFYHGISRLFTM